MGKSKKFMQTTIELTVAETRAVYRALLHCMSSERAHHSAQKKFINAITTTELPTRKKRKVK